MDVRKSTYLKRIVTLFIAEVIIFLPKLLVIMQAIPLADIRDEAAMLAVPAYLAGFEWTECMSGASYYGFGFFFLFAPLFKLGKDIVWIYKAILLITAILEGIIPLIIQYILIKYFRISSVLSILLLSVAVSFVTTNPLYNLTNEHILIMIVWCITLILFKLIYAEKIKQKRIHSFLLAILLFYGTLIHTRFLVLILAVFLGLLLYRLFHKEWLVSFFFWPVMAAGFAVSKILITFVQTLVWGSTELVNASVEISIPKSQNLIELLAGFFKVVLANLGTFFIFSGSCAVFIICALIYYFVCYFKMKNLLCKTKEEKSIFLITCIFVIAAGAIIAALGLQNMQVFALPLKEKVYSIKALTYLRYYLLFTGPLFLVGGILYCKSRWLYKKTYKVALLLAGGIYLLWYLFIIPVIGDTFFGISSYYPFSYLLQLNTGLSAENYVGIIIIMINFALFLVFVSRKSKAAVLLFTTFLLVWQYLYFPLEIALPVEKMQYEEIDKSMEYVKDVLNENTVIYVYDESDRIPFLYQTYLYEFTIKKGLPEQFDDNVILLSNHNIDEYMKDEVKGIEIDQNEWIYYKGMRTGMGYSEE